MRDTARKRAILEMLERCDEGQRLEFGMPPYSASIISAKIGGSVQSVARTLRGMAKDGQLIAVRDRQEVWNAIADGHIEMTVTAYYSARTMEHDMAAAKLWADGADERQRLALEGFSQAFGMVRQ